MKTIKFFPAVIVLLGLLLSACAPSAAPSESAANVGGGKALAQVVFTGVIESMDGDQWVIDGQTVKVDPSAVRDGSFKVGDTVKVEAAVAEDGSVTAQRVETPSAADLVDDNVTEPAPTSAPGDGAVQPLVFDDGGAEAFGTVESMTDTSITVGGQTFPFAQGAEIKGEIVSGALVKLHFTTNADGSLSVTEVEIADPSQIDNGNGNDDNSNDANSNDDNGNDDNSNDDNGNDDNSNDDNGNDDSDDDNGNDDNSGSDDDDDDNDSNGSNDNG